MSCSRIRPACLALAGALALACGEPAPPPAPGADAATAETGPTGAQWWSQARSLDPGASADSDVDDPKAVVSCELGGGPRFMRRADCLAQGGSPAAR